MRCDVARLAVSARADGEPTCEAPEELERHLAGCSSCSGFDRAVEGVRAQLRFEAVDRVPDLGPAVVARLAGEHHDVGRPAVARRVARRPATRRRGPLVAAATAAVAGLIAGATFVGLDPSPRSPAAADVPALVVAGQSEIGSLDADYTIAEREPAGGERVLDARLTYRAPESLALRVHETTAGRAPSERADGTLVVTGDRWWHEATRACAPAAGLVRCPDAPVRWSRSVTGREPFSDAAPVPLELVSPVDAFALAAAPPALGHRTTAGRPAIGLSVTAAQIDDLLEGLSAAVPLRPVHPADPVELWLDDEHLVPLAIVVRAGDDPGRAAWAAAAGTGDSPGDVVVRVEATRVRVDAADATAVEAPIAGASTTVDAGFRASPPGAAPVVDVPVPRDPPAGFAPYRSGTVTTAAGPPVGVRSWSDGRAWFTVRATASWPGGLLFGDLGLDVRTVDLGGGGIGYASGDGRKVGLHGRGVDVVVAGSLAPADLVGIASQLGVVGEPVPDDWPEARTATDGEADEALPGRLTASGIEGFGPAALRLAEDASGDVTVTETRSGPGARGFVLTQRPGSALPPPAEPDGVGVEVRGTVGRASATRGEVAWIEDGVVHTLRSDALSVGELVDVATRLVPA